MPTVLITGANRGIGLELAKHYAADGWEFVGTARDPDSADALKAIDGAEILQLDAADAASVDGFAEALGNRPVDLFINNAGVYGDDSLDRETWLKVLEVNTVAPAILTDRVKANVGASDQKKMAVISSNMGSIANNVSSNAVIYRSSKAAVNAAWKTLANRWQGEGIAIAILHPGWVRTDMGGAHASIDTHTSARGIHKVLDELSIEKTGTFFSYDGRQLNW